MTVEMGFSVPVWSVSSDNDLVRLSSSRARRCCETCHAGPLVKLDNLGLVTDEVIAIAVEYRKRMAPILDRDGETFSANDATELPLKTHHGRADAFGTRQSMMQQVQAASTTMNLLRRAVSVALMAVIVIGAAIVPVSAKLEDTDWNEVKKLKRGQQVQVVLNDARDYQGAFERWSDSEIVIRPASAEQTFARPDVIRIALIRKRSRLKHSLTGAGIGAGVGLIVGAVADRGCNSNCWFPNIAKAVFTPLGGIIGAGLGVALHAGGTKVIYRAP